MTSQHIAAVPVLLAAAVVPGAHADIINVPGDQLTIQAGIDAAADGDEVVVAVGEYRELINFNGKAITVRSTDPADAGVVLNTIINGAGAGTVVTCESGEGSNTVLWGFVITGGNGVGGGGMENSSSSPTVINCTFSGNSADYGGGIYTVYFASPTVINCTFSGNTATVRGGGMFNSFSSPTVVNCTFVGNTATVCGGGMDNVSFSSPTLTSCTFSGNSADLGGGMYNSNSSPRVTNCSFSRNSAGDGGGMYTDDSSLTVTVTVNNCILWGDSPNELVGPRTPAVAYSDVQGGFPGTGNIDADPLFLDTVAGNLRLSPGSPCIDAGNNAANAISTTDLDGNPRFVDDLATPDCPQLPDAGCGFPPVIDMGAYEVQRLPCPWDCTQTGDGFVGTSDIGLLLAQWGGPGTCDIDGGGVGVTDFLELLAAWGPCPQAKGTDLFVTRTTLVTHAVQFPSSSRKSMTPTTPSMSKSARQHSSTQEPQSASRARKSTIPTIPSPSMSPNFTGNGSP